MKNLTQITKYAGAVLAALVAGAWFAPEARAVLSLSYEENFGTHLAGDPFSGPFRINLQNFDMGTIYPSLGAVGTAAGYGAGGTGTQTVAGGNATLNGIQLAGATGAMGEDSWGIARVVTITDLDGGVVWSESARNAQLTIMFHGENDFYVNQLANGFQEIDGAGMQVNLYLQSKADPGYTAYDPLLGSAGRLGVAGYSTVTDGTLVLSTVSTPGFIHDAGTLGGLATEFTSTFNQTSGGQGQAYLSVTGGADAAAFNTNFFNAGFIAGGTADLFAQFTTTINTSAADWLVRSNDPVAGNFTPVPEPSTYGLGAVALLAGILALRRRVSGRAPHQAT